jgi:exodeoxyribonuclease VII small subunit
MNDQHDGVTGRRDVDELDYEQARVELAAVVRTLETGGLSLDETVALWERGEQLARRCTAQLAGARQRVDEVLRSAEAHDAAETDGAPAE